MPNRPKLSKTDATNQKEQRKRNRKIESSDIDVDNNTDDVSACRVVDNIGDVNDQQGKYLI